MQLFQYSRISPTILGNLKKGQIYFNVVNKVNDPYEGMIDFKVKKELETDFIKLFYQHIYDETLFSKNSFDEIKREIIFDNVNVFLKDVGISCFSESNTSLVMWGNYADNHNGICVGYDSGVGVFEHAQKVNYSKQIFTLNINSPNKITEDFMLKNTENCMYSKYEQWKYEKEWRIIFKPCKPLQYPSGALKSIHFGLRTTEKDIKAVRDASKHHPNVKYFKADLLPDKYKIIYNEIIFNDENIS